MPATSLWLDTRIPLEVNKNYLSRGCQSTVVAAVWSGSIEMLWRTVRLVLFLASSFSVTNGLKCYGGFDVFFLLDRSVSVMDNYQHYMIPFVRTMVRTDTNLETTRKHKQFFCCKTVFHMRVHSQISTPCVCGWVWVYVVLQSFSLP